MDIVKSLLKIILTWNLWREALSYRSSTQETGLDHTQHLPPKGNKTIFLSMKIVKHAYTQDRAKQIIQNVIIFIVAQFMQQLEFFQGYSEFH